jgi:hypothetical protein
VQNLGDPGDVDALGDELADALQASRSSSLYRRVPPSVRAGVSSPRRS